MKLPKVHKISHTKEEAIFVFNNNIQLFICKEISARYACTYMVGLSCIGPIPIEYLLSSMVLSNKRRFKNYKTVMDNIIIQMNKAYVVLK